MAAVGARRTPLSPASTGRADTRGGGFGTALFLKKRCSTRNISISMQLPGWFNTLSRNHICQRRGNEPFKLRRCRPRRRSEPATRPEPRSVMSGIPGRLSRPPAPTTAARERAPAESAPNAPPAKNFFHGKSPPVGADYNTEIAKTTTPRKKTERRTAKKRFSAPPHFQRRYQSISMKAPMRVASCSLSFSEKSVSTAR